MGARCLVSRGKRCAVLVSPDNPTDMDIEVLLFAVDVGHDETEALCGIPAIRSN